MTFKTGRDGMSLTKAAGLSTILLASAFSLPAQAANPTLPAPFVSRALDAVLLPIDADVIAAFGLPAGQSGVLVLAVEPGGVAASIDVQPGDVISAINGHVVAEPIELDEVVYYWITMGTFDFLFDGWRTGATYSGNATISEDSYLAVIEIASVATWSSWSYETFSYDEYYTEYSEEIAESYESSETLIEESVTSEEFSADMMSEESSEETAEDEDSDDDGVADGEDTDDDGDGIDDSAEEDDGAEHEGEEEDAGDEDAGEDDGGDDAGGDE